jgi:hypothetical protein
LLPQKLYHPVLSGSTRFSIFFGGGLRFRRVFSGKEGIKNGRTQTPNVVQVSGAGRGLEKLLRDVKVLHIYEGSSEMRGNSIACEMGR